jgi:hypothetical protein
MIPCEASKPAGFKTLPTEALTLFTRQQTGEIVLTSPPTTVT